MRLHNFQYQITEAISVSTNKTDSLLGEKNSGKRVDKGYCCCQLGIAIALGIGGAIASSVDRAIAQVVPDATLGTESSVITPQAPGSSVDLIQGGATRGANLFHSFEQFSVLSGREAFFNNATDIQNIISRVTGASISNIDGLIRANGTANLFLLNPNGIIFSPNAALAIGGSFLGSTASSVNFADGTSFSATVPQTTPLLTVSVPLGLQFGGTTRSIVNQSRATNSSGVGLQVQPGETLALLGGDVTLDGGTLRAPGGRVELGGLAEPGTVGLNVDSSLSFPVGVRLSDVSFTNGAVVNVSAISSGSIALNARNLNVSGASTLQANREPGLGVNTQAGDITLNATEVTDIANNSLINTNVLGGAAGNGGSINITTGSLLVNDGARLESNTFGQGDAGSVTINARDTVSLNGVGIRPSGLFSRVESTGVGKGGDINVTTGSLSVTNGARLSANTFGQGDAGRVIITARNTVSFDGVGNPLPSGAVSSVLGSAEGNAGDINITAESLFVRNGAQLSSSTSARGDAGSVNINTSDTASFDGITDEGIVFSGVARTNAEGNGGDINITTGLLSVTNGAQLVVNTNGRGNAGRVTILAHDTISLDGIGIDRNNNLLASGVSSVVERASVGNGGAIEVTTGALSVTNGARISANTFGRGNAGSVTIDARDTVFLDGVVSRVSLDGVVRSGNSGGVFTRVENVGVGNGGDINVTTRALSATNGARLSAGSAGVGDAGSVTIDARDTVFLDGVGSNGNFSGLVAALPLPTLNPSINESSPGQGGNLTIKTGQLIVQNDAEVNVRSERLGSAGEIRVEADSIELNDRGKLQAEAVLSQGGNINLQVRDVILMRRQGLISATAGGTGNGGNVIIGNATNAPLIVAFPTEDSDIIAQASEGQGGNINIFTQGIFGLEVRNPRTPQTSDIDASSEVGIDGTVEINRLDIDPSQGLVALPAELVDASNQIAAGCAGGSESVARNEFIITGRGGLPPSPSEALRSDLVQVDLGAPIQSTENSASTAIFANPTRVSAPNQIVEAQGWAIAPDGQIILTASAPNVTPHSPALTPASCNDS